MLSTQGLLLLLLEKQALLRSPLCPCWEAELHYPTTHSASLAGQTHGDGGPEIQRERSRLLSLFGRRAVPFIYVSLKKQPMCFDDF